MAAEDIDLLRSGFGKIFVGRILMPSLFVVASVLIFTDNRVTIYGHLLAVPLILLALFGYSLVQIDADSAVIRFRRFFKWRTLKYEQITDCGISRLLIFPAGYLRLRRPVFPWGKLYFVLGGHAYYSSHAARDVRVLIDYIEERMATASFENKQISVP